MTVRIRDKLGRCPRCMGLSLGLSLVGGALLALSFAAGAPTLLTIALAVPAVGLSALFVAHVVVFAERAVRAREPCISCGGAREPAEKEIPRRQILGIVGGALVAALALSLSNIPGVRRAVAQDPLPCEDIGGPIHRIGPVCVTANENEDQLKARLLQEAQKWIEDNKGGFENTARRNCADDACKIETQRCVAVHYNVGAHVNCFSDRNCESGRACEGIVSMGVRCRCINGECGTAKLDPPVEITVELCSERQNPTKDEFKALCKTAHARVQDLIKAAAERTCAQQSCPPKNNKRPPCVVRKIEHSEIKCARVPDKQNCCRCTATISAVQCKCA